MNNSCLSRRGFLGSAGAAGVAAMAGRHALAAAGEPKPVRVAFIGVGSRGTGLLRQMLRLDGVEAPAICDINADHLDRAVEIVKQARGNTAAGFSKGPYDYRRMLERDDFDAVLIATPAILHADMAVDSLAAGKHVASEVPAAYTVDECWALVRAKEKTGKRYMLLENYTGEYDHELWKTTGKEAAKSGHGGGDYLELLEFVAAVREDREPYIDVYDAASWSSVVELSARSIDAGGGRVEIPDFTGGRWEKWSL